MTALAWPTFAVALLLQQLPPGSAPGAPPATAPAAPSPEESPAPPAPANAYGPVAPAPESAGAYPAPWGQPATAYAPVYAPVATAGAGPLPRTGLFAIGLGLDPLQLGPMQVFSAGGAAYGIAGGIGVEIDLGPRLALRVPLEIAYAGSSDTDAAGVEQSTVFLYAGLSPGVTYRFRFEQEQRWTAFVGGAVKLGAFMFGRRLLDVAPNPPPSTMQEFTRLGAAPDLTAGFWYTPFRWFALRIAVDYTYIYVAHTSVHALAETIAPQITF